MTMVLNLGYTLESPLGEFIENEASTTLRDSDLIVMVWVRGM